MGKRCGALAIACCLCFSRCFDQANFTIPVCASTSHERRRKLRWPADQQAGWRLAFSYFPVTLFSMHKQ
jgi:hypothetical protein